MSAIYAARRVRDVRDPKMLLLGPDRVVAQHVGSLGPDRVALTWGKAPLEEAPCGRVVEDIAALGIPPFPSLNCDGEDFTGAGHGAGRVGSLGPDRVAPTSGKAPLEEAPAVESSRTSWPPVVPSPRTALAEISLARTAPPGVSAHSVQTELHLHGGTPHWRRHRLSSPPEIVHRPYCLPRRTALAKISLAQATAPGLSAYSVQTELHVNRRSIGACALRAHNRANNRPM